MDKQEIFETVSRHLFAQGVQALMPDPTGNRENSDREDGMICAYRGENDTKCAFGILIPDQDYNPDMENISAYMLIRERGLEGFEDFKNHTSLISELQGIHDEETNWRSTEDMRDALRAAGWMFNLDGAFLETLSFGDR